MFGEITDMPSSCRSAFIFSSRLAVSPSRITFYGTSARVAQFSSTPRSVRHSNCAATQCGRVHPRFYACAWRTAEGNAPPGGWPLGPPNLPLRIARRYWLKGLRDDIARRAPLYASDWIDGVQWKSVPAVLYLYFACLAPVVAFGGITFALTGGSMGVVEFLVSAGISGMLYAALSGQPLTFIAPTGLTLAFTCALYGFCEVNGMPFLSTYAWVGVWAALILCLASLSNCSDLIKHCTRFTDDIFNSLIATNFVFEAGRSLLGSFFESGADKTTSFAAVALALGTYLIGSGLTGLRSSRFFFRRARNVLADFGPVLSICIMSTLAWLPAISKVGLQSLAVPSSFSLAGDRPLFIPMLSTPLSVKIAAFIPALLLTCLFFLDQNISVRVVNSPAHQLKKGPGYHLDLLVLAVCTFLCSICGLPLMCAGTVQSVAHVRALTEVQSRRGTCVTVSVQENRLTGFLIHVAILGTVFLLPLIKRIPMAVISGLFLFLGRNMMVGNSFLARLSYLFMDPGLYPENSPMHRVPAGQVHMFTLLQLLCLSSLWVLKLNKKTSMFFPAVIAMLMLIRARLVPVLFRRETLETLDGDVFTTENPGCDETGNAGANPPAMHCS